MNWKEHKKQLMKNAKFRYEYEALEPEYKLMAAMIRQRLKKEPTQKQAADLLNTKQEIITHMGRGESRPSLSTIKKVTDALDAEIDAEIDAILRPK